MGCIIPFICFLKLGVSKYPNKPSIILQVGDYYFILLTYIGLPPILVHVYASTI